MSPAAYTSLQSQPSCLRTGQTVNINVPGPEGKVYCAILAETPALPEYRETIKRRAELPRSPLSNGSREGSRRIHPGRGPHYHWVRNDRNSYDKEQKQKRHLIFPIALGEEHIL